MLKGAPGSVHGDAPLGYELSGNAALFRGDYKLVRNLAPTGDGRPPAHLGQCVSWDFDGPVVEKVYPMFFRWRAQPMPAKDS